MYVRGRGNLLSYMNENSRNRKFLGKAGSRITNNAIQTRSLSSASLCSTRCWGSDISFHNGLWELQASSSNLHVKERCLLSPWCPSKVLGLPWVDGINGLGRGAHCCDSLWRAHRPMLAHQLEVASQHTYWGKGRAGYWEGNSPDVHYIKNIKEYLA